MRRLTVRHQVSHRPLSVTVESGKVTGITELPHHSTENTEWWIAPSLVDIQVNGYAGVDFQRDTTTAEDLLNAAITLQNDGCSLFCLTLITAEWRTMLHQLQRLRALRDSVPELKQRLLGWHLEGPFLSSEPGFCGAHNPSLMIDPTSEHLDELKDVVGDDAVLLTLAPERHNAIAFIEEATQRSIAVSLGHTNASSEQLHSAAQAGARSFTHMGNAIPQQLHRHDNVLWRMLDTPCIASSLIPDGIHLPGEVIRTLWKAFGADRLYFTTDAMAAAGAPAGVYTIGALEVVVGEDQIVRQPGKPHFAGSALRPIQGVFRAAELLGIAWQDAWTAFSRAPLSHALRLPHEVVLHNPHWHLMRVASNGSLLHHEPVIMTPQAPINSLSPSHEPKL